MARQPRSGRPVERRNGQEGFAWDGVATKVDPAGNPPNRPRDLVNVRIQGGVIISRPNFKGDGAYVPVVPLQDAETADITEDPPFEVIDSFRWTPHWMTDHNSAAGVRLWWVAEPIVANTFGYLGFIDTDSDQGIQSVATIRLQGTGFTLPIEKYNNEIYLGDFGGLRKLFLVPSVEGATQPPVDTSLIADEVIVSYPGFLTGAMQEHAGLLFFAVVGGAAGSVYSWDGLAVTLETSFLTAGTLGVVMATYKDTLVVGIVDDAGAGQGNLMVRDATGAWTTHTLGGFNCNRYPTSMAEYGNLLYIMDGNQKIFTWDGATIALGHTLVLGGTSINCCAKLAGRLYYSWLDTANAVVTLGFVDQDNDAGNRYRDRGVRGGIKATTAPIQAMAQYRGRLWVAINDFGTQRLMWHSQQFMPYDKWQDSNNSNKFTANSMPVSGVTNLRML